MTVYQCAGLVRFDAAGAGRELESIQCTVVSPIAATALELELAGRCGGCCIVVAGREMGWWWRRGSGRGRAVEGDDDGERC